MIFSENRYPLFGIMLEDHAELENTIRFLGLDVGGALTVQL